MSAFKFLISGFDTIECAYYLIASDDYKLDFIELAAQKESMVRAKLTELDHKGIVFNHEWIAATRAM